MNTSAMNTFRVAHPKLDDAARIIVISDIHGNLAYLRGLTDKLHLRRDDQLVLLGDLVEKGTEVGYHLVPQESYVPLEKLL